MLVWISTMGVPEFYVGCVGAMALVAFVWHVNKGEKRGRGRGERGGGGVETGMIRCVRGCV